MLRIAKVSGLVEPLHLLYLGREQNARSGEESASVTALLERTFNNWAELLAILRLR
jgi:hypothetical protein